MRLIHWSCLIGELNVKALTGTITFERAILILLTLENI
jgi:hypothetical protein